MTELTGVAFDAIEIGQRAEFNQTLTAERVDMFAAVSGDLNPVHLDSEFASTTQFGQRIGHGAWVASLISAAIAMHLPGPGTIYRGQQISFTAPVMIGDTVTVKLEVTSKRDRVRLVVLDCQVSNQRGETVAKGEAQVIAPAESQSVPEPKCPSFERVN